MTSTTQNHTKSYKLRSISFPSRPSAQVLQDTITLSKQLDNLKSCLASSSLPQTQTLSNALHVINHLYNIIKNLLINSPQTLQSLSNSLYENFVTDMIDESMIYVDICGKSRDAVCEMSECTCELQSALRRKKGNEIDIESNVERYIRLRKNMKKGLEKLLQELKQLENKFGHIFSIEKVTNDQALYEVVKVLNEVSLITNVIFQKLLIFLSVSIVKTKTSKWTSLAKLMTKGGADNVEKGIKNEFVDVDFEVMNMAINGKMEVFKDDSSIDSTLGKLEGLDLRLKALEFGLEILFKNLIYMRVTYLNICSQ